MKPRHIIMGLATGVMLSCATVAQATTVDEALTMILNGEPQEALAALDSIIAAQPRNASAEYAKGKCLVALNNDAAAITAFNSAHKKGSNDALLGLAEIAVREYRTDDAESYLDTYRTYIRRNPKKKLTDQSDPVDEKLGKVRSMLDRVAKIVVIDSLIVDSEDFFRAYRLSPESGSLNSPDILPDNFGYASPTVVYRTEDNRSMIWAAEDSTGNFVLVTSDCLIGDSWETPYSVNNELGDGGDANYPFLMADGITLYYAADGENSLGGYDIFMTRRGENGYLQPQNIGLPYNSPYDDYMLAIDEITGVGWWASDRNRIPGKVTIYLFIPSEIRVNVPFDAPDLTQRARLTSIAATHEPNADYSDLIARVRSIAPTDSRQSQATFYFPLSDGRVLTSPNQFRSERARDGLQRYLALVKTMDDTATRLEQLRQQYANGDTSVASEILQLEREQQLQRRRLMATANEIIKAETQQ